MKEEIAFKQSKRLGHTRQHFNLMTALAEWSISDAGGSKKVFGEKPLVADYTPTDLTEEAGRAAKGNLKNYDDIIALLDRMIPGFSEQQKQGSKNTLSMLRGEIPEDVQREVQRSSAFRSLMGGYAGSGMSKAVTARDLGLTSLDLMGRGENSAQKWASIAEGAASPFIVTAPAQGEATFKNNLYKQAVDQFKYNVAAAPDPGAAGQYNMQTALGMTAMSFGLGSAAGAGGGRTTTPAPANNANTGAYPTNWWGGG